MKTENVALRILIACAIGAGFGTLFAGYFGQFWALGTTIGGLIGYLIYDIEEVVTKTKQAFLITIKWRPSEEWRKEKLTAFKYLCLVVIPNTLIVLYLFIERSKNEMSYLISYLFLIPFAVGLMRFISLLLHHVEENKKEKSRDTFHLKWLNPVGIMFAPIFILYSIIKVLHEERVLLVEIAKWIFVTSWKAILLIGKFFKTFFILIHSQARFICGVDSLIGALVGHHFANGNVLAGAITGIILGLANYYFISIKWLKLQPRI